VTVTCSLAWQLYRRYLGQKKICYMKIFPDISSSAVTHGIISHVDAGDVLGCWDIPLDSCRLLEGGEISPHKIGTGGFTEKSAWTGSS
jgi:hypothetical protein